MLGNNEYNVRRLKNRSCSHVTLNYVVSSCGQVEYFLYLFYFLQISDEEGEGNEQMLQNFSMLLK